MTVVQASPQPPAPAVAAPDLRAVKERQQTVWASGDFAVIGTTLQIVGESLAEAIDLRAGERVLDVAAGNGNATLAAARRFAHVTSTDYVPALLDKAESRAKAEGLTVEFRVADAEELPYADGAFDVALSSFGVMFTPDHARAAQELLRVVRPGGRIGLANWTPEGFIGRLFRIIGTYLLPQPGLQSPLLWGTESHLVELFGAHTQRMHCERKMFNFRYQSAEHWLQIFRDYYGPTHRAFAALDAPTQQRLAADITSLLQTMNTAGAASLVVPGEYLEVVIEKR